MNWQQLYRLYVEYKQKFNQLVLSTLRTSADRQSFLRHSSNQIMTLEAFLRWMMGLLQSHSRIARGLIRRWQLGLTEAYSARVRSALLSIQ